MTDTTADARSGSCPRRWKTAAVLLPLLLTAIAYAPGFHGFFIGDDLASLHQLFIWNQKDELGDQVVARFRAGITEHGSFYRPLIVASRSLNYLLAGTTFAGWYIVNYTAHLFAVLLVFFCVSRLGVSSQRQTTIAAAAAATWFGLFPLLAEAVFWPSARSDLAVTLFSLLGLAAWLGPNRRRTAMPWALPIALLFALLFKESAAVLPLQVSLVWLMVPRLRGSARTLSLLVCYGLVAAFFIYRAQLFGNPWEPYAAQGTDAGLPELRQLWAGVQSLGSWWRGLFGTTPAVAALFGLGSIAAIVLALSGSRYPHVALALLFAAAGLVLATLLNLGQLVASGEGGRLFHTPAAWLALALGVALLGRRQNGRIACVAIQIMWGAVFIALLSGGVAQQAILQTAVGAQRQLSSTVESIALWAEQHNEPALLLVPDHLGPVVVGRNAHSFALPPIQPSPLLHQVMPTLPSELLMRYAQYDEGMLDTLENLRLHYWDLEAFTNYQGQRRPRWPEHVLCWSPVEDGLVDMAAPPPGNPAEWSATILTAAEKRGCRFG